MLWSLLLISLITLCSTEVKLVLNGTTSQSTVYIDNVHYSSERATDGNQSTCAHTWDSINSWWRIDLLGVYRISSIRIYNKQEKHTNISGALIYIGNSREKNGTTNYMSNRITNFTQDNWNNLTYETNVSGRYITVVLPKRKSLVLCEVEIFGSKKESPFELVRQNKIWEDALHYCRCHYMDLASIVDEETQAWAELEAKKASTCFVWLGLRYTRTLGFWFWVDDMPLNFTRWEIEEKIEECGMSGVMHKEENHLWSSKSDSTLYNFICAKH